jgi:RNA polymerase sigma factor (sigma-70 family)
MLRSHRGTLLWIARRWTGAADEAEDALQRAMEIYVRRLDSIDPASELSWLKVVVRHEAMALRRARLQGVPLGADDAAERIPAPDVAVQERIEREERNARSLEALAQLKPDERTALLLKAEGYSYREIARLSGAGRVPLGARLRFSRWRHVVDGERVCAELRDFGLAIEPTPPAALGLAGRDRVVRGVPHGDPVEGSGSASGGCLRGSRRADSELATGRRVRPRWGRAGGPRRRRSRWGRAGGPRRRRSRRAQAGTPARRRPSRAP